MEKGRIVEQGTHDELVERRGAYCALVKRQEDASILNSDSMSP